MVWVLLLAETASEPDPLCFPWTPPPQNPALLMPLLSSFSKIKADSAASTKALTVLEIRVGGGLRPQTLKDTQDFRMDFWLDWVWSQEMTAKVEDGMLVGQGIWWVNPAIK